MESLKSLESEESEESLDGEATARMRGEYSSLAPVGQGGELGGWRAGRAVKTFSSHCATVLLTLLVVTVLLLSMEIAGRGSRSMTSVQEVNTVSQWDAGMAISYSKFLVLFFWIIIEFGML